MLGPAPPGGSRTPSIVTVPIYGGPWMSSRVPPGATFWLPLRPVPSFLVLGTGEHTGLGRAAARSTSRHCLSHAAPPVITVPATANDFTPGPATASVAATDSPM